MVSIVTINKQNVLSDIEAFGGFIQSHFVAVNRGVV